MLDSAFCYSFSAFRDFVLIDGGIMAGTSDWIFDLKRLSMVLFERL